MTISTFLCLTPPPLQLMCWEKKVGILYFNTAPLVLLTPMLRITSEDTNGDRGNTDGLSVWYIRNMGFAKNGDCKLE